MHSLITEAAEKSGTLHTARYALEQNRDVLAVPDTLKVKQVRRRNVNEQALLDLLLQGLTDGNELQIASQLDVATFNQTLTMLELSGKVRPLGANKWALA